jgi:hypothetical protein
MQGISAASTSQATYPRQSEAPKDEGIRSGVNQVGNTSASMPEIGTERHTDAASLNDGAHAASPTMSENVTKVSSQATETTADTPNSGSREVEKSFNIRFAQDAHDYLEGMLPDRQKGGYKHQVAYGNQVGKETIWRSQYMR